MKKLTCLFLSLLLSMTLLCAQAAPLRDRKAVSLTDEELASLRNLLDARTREALSITDGDVYAGAYIVTAYEENGRVAAEADLYEEESGDQPPETASEEALTWAAGAKIVLLRDDKAEAGFTIESFDIVETYGRKGRETHLSPDGEYEITLREDFIASLTETDDGFTTDNGVAKLTLTVSDRANLSLSDAAAPYIGKSEYEAVMILDETASVTAEGESGYVCLYMTEGSIYTFVLSFPKDNRMEYTLEGELMRNSFIVYALGVG